MPTPCVRRWRSDRAWLGSSGNPHLAGYGRRANGRVHLRRTLAESARTVGGGPASRCTAAVAERSIPTYRPSLALPAIRVARTPVPQPTSSTRSAGFTSRRDHVQSRRSGTLTMRSTLCRRMRPGDVGAEPRDRDPRLGTCLTQPNRDYALLTTDRPVETDTRDRIRGEW